MMCLGWYNRPECAARTQVTVAAPASGILGGGPINTPCPDITWFWVTAGALVVGGMLHKGSK